MRACGVHVHGRAGRDHAAQGRAEQVGPAQGKWHRAGLACSTGQACSAQVMTQAACAGLRLCNATRLAAQVRLAAGEACGQLRVARERGHARRSHYCGDGAQFFVHAAVGRVCGGHCAHRLGHLDRSGLFGGGRRVAWGGSGDRVRLHVVACARKVAGGVGGHRAHPWAGDVVQGSAGRRPHGVRREAARRTRRQRREHAWSAGQAKRQAVQAGGAAGPRARPAAPGCSMFEG